MCPSFPGHEGVGTVVASAPSQRVKEGDRVGLLVAHVLWLLAHCRTGWETLCGGQKNTGYSVNGSFAESSSPIRTTWADCPRPRLGAAAPVLCAGVTVYKG